MDDTAATTAKDTTTISGNGSGDNNNNNNSNETRTKQSKKRKLDYQNENIYRHLDDKAAVAAAEDDDDGSDEEEQDDDKLISPSKRARLTEGEESTLQSEKRSKKKKNVRVSDPKTSDSRYAYVFLVMKGDKYVKGALVGCHSIKLTGSKCDVVCMVTEDVSDEAVTILRRRFDRVVQVDYISHPTPQLRGGKQQQMYDRWTDESFTKWNCLAMTEYEKVLFIDADAVCVKNCDHLFEMHAPAATFSRREARPYAKTGLYNIYLDADGNAPQHGDPIRVRDVKRAVKKGYFVIIGTTVLLQPNEDHFAKLKEIITRDEVYNAKNNRSVSLFDEISISELYCSLGKRWTYISQIYNYIPWSRYGTWLEGTNYTEKDIHVVHFFGVEKPWQLPREEWPDLKKFWELADDMLEKDAELRDWWDDN